jgi:hypothetical protein
VRSDTSQFNPARERGHRQKAASFNGDRHDSAPSTCRAVPRPYGARRRTNSIVARPVVLLLLQLLPLVPLNPLPDLAKGENIISNYRSMLAAITFPYLHGIFRHYLGATVNRGFHFHHTVIIAAPTSASGRQSSHDDSSLHPSTDQKGKKNESPLFTARWAPMCSVGHVGHRPRGPSPMNTEKKNSPPMLELNEAWLSSMPKRVNSCTLLVHLFFLHICYLHGNKLKS